MNALLFYGYHTACALVVPQAAAASWDDSMLSVHICVVCGRGGEYYIYHKRRIHILGLKSYSIRERNLMNKKLFWKH